MALTKLNSDLNIISSLDDEPNDIGGLTASQLKAKFDEAGNGIKTYINGTLTEEIDAGKADKTELQGLVLGQIPDKTITTPKLSDGAVTKDKLDPGIVAELDSKGIAPIVGTTAPTSATVGVVGQFYLNTTDGSLYKCIAISGNTYTWEPIVDEPVGSIKNYAGTDLGDAYLLCNGANFNPSIYSELFSKLPLSFGTQLMDSNLKNSIFSFKYIPETKYFVAVGVSQPNYSPFIMYSTSLDGPWYFKQLSTVLQVSSYIDITYFQGKYYVCANGPSNTGLYLLSCETPGGNWGYITLASVTNITFSGIANNSTYIMILTKDGTGNLSTYYSTNGANFGSAAVWCGAQVTSPSSSYLSYINGYFVITYSSYSGGYYCNYLYNTLPNGNWTKSQFSTAGVIAYGSMQRLNNYYCFPFYYQTNPQRFGYMWGLDIANCLNPFYFSPDTNNSYIFDVEYNTVTKKYIMCGSFGNTSSTSGAFIAEASSFAGQPEIISVFSNLGSNQSMLAIDPVTGEYAANCGCNIFGKMSFLPKISLDKAYAYIKAK